MARWFRILACALLVSGCATASIPTPTGDVRVRVFLNGSVTTCQPQGSPEPVWVTVSTDYGLSHEAATLLSPFFRVLAAIGAAGS